MVFCLEHLRLCCFGWEHLRMCCLGENIWGCVVWVRTSEDVLFGWEHLRMCCFGWEHLRMCCFGWEHLRMCCLGENIWGCVVWVRTSEDVLFGWEHLRMCFLVKTIWWCVLGYKKPLRLYSICCLVENIWAFVDWCWETLLGWD
jgi:hypothetical protein